MPDRIDDLYSEKWFTDMERTVDLLEKQEAAILKVNAALKSAATDAKGAKTMEDLAAAQTKVHASTQQAAAGFDDFNAALKQAEGLKAKYNGSTKEMVQITLSSARATKELAAAARIQQTAHNASEKAARAEKKAMDELTNEYGMLSKAYTEATLRAKNMVLQQGESSKNAQQAIKDAKALGDALKKLDYSVGQHQRNVGNYSSAFNGLGFSIRTIAGELPNLGISLRTFTQSLSNNIGPLSDSIRQAREQNKLLQAEGKATVSIGKQIASSIFSWQTLILAAVAAITYLVSNMGKGNKAAEQAEKANKKYADSLESIAEAERSSAQQEIAHMNVLISVAANVEASMKNRLRAVRELQKTYPDRFGSLTTEAILEGRVAEAVRATTNELLKRAKAQAAEKRLAASAEQEFDLRESQEQVIKDLAEARVRLKRLQDADVNSGTTTAYRTTNQAIDNQRRKVAALEEQYNANTTAIIGTVEAQRQFAEQAKVSASEAGDSIFGADPAARKEKVVKEKKAETEDIYKELIAQMENEAQIQKAIADDTEVYYETRLIAYDAYMQEQIAIAGLQVDNEAEMQTAINKIILKGIEDRRKIEDDETKRKQRAIKNAGDVKTGGPSQTREQFEQEEERKYQAGRRRREEMYDTVQAVADANSVFTERRIREIDEEIEAINKRRDAEIEAYKESADFAYATEKEKALKISAINAQANEEERIANEKRRQEQRRDAFIHKAITVAKIAIETALAVVHQLGSGDPYTAFGRAAAVGVMGAAQIAAAVAAPLPEFAEGTGPEGSPEGPAKVGERGTELGITPDGKLFLTPSTETKMYLKKGTHIIPADKTAELMKYYAVGMPGLRESNVDRTTEVLGGLKENAQVIANAIRGKQFPSQNQKPGWWDKYEYNKTK